MSDREVKGISPEEWSRVWHVYDAAMALLEASEFDEDGCPTADYAALCALMAACRRAKEGQ